MAASMAAVCSGVGGMKGDGSGDPEPDAAGSGAAADAEGEDVTDDKGA
jgi:hypothetical protein